MILSASMTPKPRGTLVNADTLERIPFAYWADTESGEWKAWAATPDGRHQLLPRRSIQGRCRLVFVPDGGGRRLRGQTGGRPLGLTPGGIFVG